jgi:hypothetical protein
MSDCACGAHDKRHRFWCFYVTNHDNPYYHCTCRELYEDDKFHLTYAVCLIRSMGLWNFVRNLVTWS